MRIRSIKPEFWRSPTIAALDPFDRLLFIGLWSYVDDHGRGRDDVAEIIGDLFSRDMFKDPAGTAAKVHGGLANLFTRGLIVRYEVAGADFLAISAWAEHQRVDRPKDSRFPAPDQGKPRSRGIDANVRGNHATEQGTGNREQGDGTWELLTESVSLGSNSARENETDSAERRQGSERLAAAMGLDLGKVIEAALRIDRELDHGEALRLSTIIIAKAPTEPDSATAYVLGAFKRSPLEVQQVIDTEVMT